MAQDTRIKVTNNRSIELERGKIFCEVAKGYIPFRIRTNQGEITVLGTKFQVELIDNRLTATVVSGEVKIEVGQKFATLKPNQQLIVENKNITEKVKDCDANSITKWANKVLYPKFFELRQVAKTNVNLPTPVSKVYVLPINYKKISSIILEWDKSIQSNSNFTIYMYDEELKPLLRYKISKELMSQYDGSLTIPLSEDINSEEMGLIHIEILSDDIDQLNYIPFTKVYAKS